MSEIKLMYSNLSQSELSDAFYDSCFQSFFHRIKLFKFERAFRRFKVITLCKITCISCMDFLKDDSDCEQDLSNI